MDVYLTNEFIKETLTLLKSNSHKDIEQLLIQELFCKKSEDIKGYRLSGDNTNSRFLKVRVSRENEGKSGGYRVYAWIIIKEDNLYLTYIHPKKGRRSQASISNDRIKELIKSFITERRENNFIKVENKDDIIINSQTQNPIFA